MVWERIYWASAGVWWVSKCSVGCIWSWLKWSTWQSPKTLFYSLKNIRIKWTKLDNCQNLKLSFISYNFLLISFVDKSFDLRPISGNPLWNAAQVNALDRYCILQLKCPCSLFKRWRKNSRVFSMPFATFLMPVPLSFWNCIESLLILFPRGH